MKKELFKKELSYIKNEEYLKNAEILLDLLPDYFFEVAASSTGKYHPKFALLKHGKVKEKYTKFDHPLIAANFVCENKDKTSFNDKDIEFICHVISSHMGPYNTNPYSDVVLPIPKDKYQKFVHMCDLLASRKFLNVEFNGNEIIE